MCQADIVVASAPLPAAVHAPRPPAAADVELGADGSSELLNGVVTCCVGIHQSVERTSRKFYNELRRYNYVTPTSYLELLGTFIRLLGEKRTEIAEGRRRLEIGLQKLLNTAAQVGGREGGRGCGARARSVSRLMPQFCAQPKAQATCVALPRGRCSRHRGGWCVLWRRAAAMKREG